MLGLEAVIALIVWAAIQAGDTLLRHWLPSAGRELAWWILCATAFSFAIGTTLLWFLVLLSSIYLIDLAILSESLPHGLRSFPFLSRVVLALGSFLLAFVSLHILLYCFGGYAKEKLGELWPKGIDYAYYLFGALLLVSVIAELHDQNEIMTETLRVQVVASIYLLSFKLVKTSVEVFPNIFSPKGVLVRDIRGNEIAMPPELALLRLLGGSPAKIERKLRIDPRVDDAVVVRRPDIRWGKVPVVVVARNDDSLTVEELCEQLADYKQPKDVRLFALPELPLSSGGKIQRHMVEAWLASVTEPGSKKV